ncbi:hypothetical protein L3X38_032588 [Prunus dulcis]|uniref:Uncharacterized protein n=1 Tax=Prunus dulcis TaxID=3755 RepID=A0AAD4VFG3_PRUDU|nr:hypothetical protein L3X38_032588 [Prunus dulcis]
MDIESTSPSVLASSNSALSKVQGDHVYALFGRVNLEKGTIFSKEEGIDLWSWKNLQKTRKKKQSSSFRHREVKIGVLYKVSMWDFVQIAVVVTRVLGD